MRLRTLAVEQKPHAGPVRQNHRVAIGRGNLRQESVDPQKQGGERGPVVPEQFGRQGHVAVRAQRIARQEPVDHRFASRKTAPVAIPHVRIHVEQVEPPLPIEPVAGIAPTELLEQVFEQILRPELVGHGALDRKPPRQHAQPLGPGQRANHHRKIRRAADRDAVFGREPGDQRGGLVRAALRIQIRVERQVLKIGRLAALFVAPQRAVIFGAGCEHPPHEQALADLRGAVDRGGHRHLGRAVQAGGPAAQLRKLEFLAFGNRQQVLALPAAVEFGHPIGERNGQLFGPFRFANQFAVAIVRKTHDVYGFSALSLKGI